MNKERPKRVSPRTLWWCCSGATLLAWVFFGVMSIAYAYGPPSSDGVSVMEDLLRALEILSFTMVGLTFGSLVGWLMRGG